MNPAAPAKKTAAFPTRQLTIVLGWLGLVLFGVNTLVNDWHFETTNYDLLRSFDTVKNVLFALWPIAVWLQLGPRLPAQLRSWFDIALCLLLFPWWLYCGFLLLSEDESPWQDERVFVATTAPPMRIVRQYQDIFVTTNTRYRVVRLTPLGWWWQRVEPADTSEFALN